MTTERLAPPHRHTASWWFKSTGHVLIWIGGAAAIGVTMFLAGTGGIDATRFNRPGIVGAGLILAGAGACFAASKLTTARPVYHEVTADDDEYALVDSAR